MKQRKILNLVLAIFLLLVAIVIIWETLLVGFNSRTILGVVNLVVSVVLFRRWYQGD
jgi:hypothetical protein